MSECPRCHAQFTCAMADQGSAPCWCTALPAQTTLPIYPEIRLDQPRCFCPDCMRAWLADHPPAPSR